jgi:sugar phosphate permease
MSAEDNKPTDSFVEDASAPADHPHAAPGHSKHTASFEAKLEEPAEKLLAELPDGETERKLLRKLDWYLVPWLSLLYLLSFLDRTSIGNAKLYHLEQDLNISDPQYNIALTIFFISYALFEVPSNVFLKRLRPSIWLSFTMLMWGIMMTVQGLVHDYGGLLTMRWFLGLFEAGLFPGVNYYLSWCVQSVLPSVPEF